MADEYDGRVVIDTELDNTGFEQGSDKLKASVSGLAQAINGISGTFAKTFSKKWKMPEPELPEKEDMELPQPEPVKPEVDTTDFDAGTRRVHEGMEQITRDVGTDLPEPKPVEPELDSKEFDKQAAKMQSSIGRIIGEIDRMVATSAQGFRSTSAVLAFNNKLDLTAEKIAEAKEQLAEFAAQQIPTDAYSETTKSIEKAEKALLKLYERRDQMEDLGVSEGSKQWQRLEMQIRAAEEEVERYEMAADRMRETGQAFVDPAATEQYTAMREQIEQAERDIQTNAGLIKQEQIEQARMNVLVAQEKVAHAGNIVARKQALRELQDAQNALAMVAEKSVTPAPDPAAGSAWRRFAATIKSGAANARAELGKLGTGAQKIVGGIKSVAQRVTRFFSGLRKQGGGIDSLFKKITGLKTMLMSRIKRTFISFLFQQVQESFNELAKFDARFDKSVSNLRNRTSELGANIMASLGGLIRQIEPIITKAIDAASAAVTKLNAVMTAIRGEGVMQVAVRRTESYADSLRDSTKAAKDAKKAQDKLNATLTTYDEIHKLEGPQDTGADLADTGADAEKVVYENVPVESILGSMDTLGRDIANRIVQGIKNGDWAEAGRAISDGLNAVVAKLDEKLKAARPKAEKAAVNLADALNGMVEEFDGYALGKTIADGLNLALGTANAFLERFNFYSFGATIGDGITGAVQNFEWETAGRTLGNAINGVIDTAKGIFEHTDWRGAGAGLGRSLNTLFETIEWGKAAQTLSTGIIGIFDSISAFLETVEWKGLGEKVWEFVTNIDWGGIARSVFETAGAALGGLASFLWGIISSAWADLRAWWEENSGDTGDSIIKRLLIGIGNALIGIGDWILTNVWAPFAEGFLKAFGLSDEEASGLMQFGRQAIAGFFNGIAEGLANVIVWVDENIWQPLKKAVKQAFGIHSPSTKMAELGEFVTAGLLAGIRDGLKNIKSWIVKKVFDPIMDALKAAFGITSGAASKLLDIGKNVIDGFLNGVKDGMTNIGNWLETNVTGKFVGKFKDLLGIHSPSTLFKKLGGFLIEGFENGLTAGWDAITGFFDRRIAAFDETGKRMVESLRGGIQNAWGALQQAFNEGIESLPNAVRLDDFRAAGSNIMDAIRRGFVNARDSLVGDVWRVMGDLQGWFNTDAHSSFYDIGVYLANGLAEGIEAGWYGVDGVCQYLAGGTLNLVRSLFGIASPSKVMAEIGEYLAEGLAIGIDNGERGVLQTAGALARNVTAEMTTDADLEFSADTMVTGLDLVADKLAAIARTFAAIGRMFPDMTAVPVPAAALGAITPAQTRVFSDDRGGDNETNRLLNKLITRIGELEEQVASRPLRLESKLYVEQREIGRATNDFNASQSRISNGTLGGGSSKW